MTDDEYIEWLLNVSNGPYRIMLITFNHSSGSVRFGSQPWMSDSFVPYDAFVVSEPTVRDSLTDFRGVGDVDCINLDPDGLDWLSLEFRGYPCLWQFGDIRWPLGQFRHIANLIGGGCRALGKNKYRFDMLDAGQSLLRTFATADTTLTGTAQSVIDSMFVSAGLPPVVYNNMTTANLDISINVTPTSKVSDVLREITNSVGAYPIISQSGDLVVFQTDEAQPLILTEDDIDDTNNGPAMIEVIPAYTIVALEMADGTVIKQPTGASVGSISDEYYEKTLLTNPAQAQTRLNKLANFYSKTRGVWEVPVFDIAQLMEAGKTVYVNHPQLLAVGVINRIKRTPLSISTVVEVTI